MSIAVYIIRHHQTGYFYIGSSGEVNRRRSNHLSMLYRDAHYAKELQAAYNVDPQLDWEYIPCHTREAAYDLEDKLIQANAANPLMCNNPNVSVRGGHHAPEHLRTPESIAKAVIAKTGGQHSEETKAKMSASRKGIVKSPEWLESIAESTRKKVIVDGVVYDSHTAAAAAYGITVTNVKHRIDNQRPKWHGWRSYP